jgi:predicted RNase H-like nuclease (RuvC/YqgF family)
MTSEQIESTCDLCGLPMLPSEAMFRFHGYSESCEQAKERVGSSKDHDALKQQFEELKALLDVEISHSETARTIEVQSARINNLQSAVEQLTAENERLRKEIDELDVQGGPYRQRNKQLIDEVSRLSAVTNTAEGREHDA